MPDIKPAPGGKVCFICHEDCSTRPRTKDAQGRYACKACLDQALSRTTPTASSAPPRPDTPNSPSRPGPASIPADADFSPSHEGDPVLDAIIESEQSKFGPPCESCGIVLPKGTVVCTRCGYSRVSNRNVRTRIVAAPREKRQGPDIRAVLSSISPWTHFGLAAGIILGLVVLGSINVAFIVAAMVLLGVYSIVATVALIASAFLDERHIWGIILLVSWLFLIGLFVNLFYAAFKCERPHIKTAFIGSIILIILAPLVGALVATESMRQIYEGR